MTKLRKTAVSILAVLSATCLASGAVAYAFRDNGKNPSFANSDIRKVNASIDSNIQDYFDSSVVQKLPETVASNDEVSVIVSMSTRTVMDAYLDSDGRQKFSDYAVAKEGRRVAEQVTFDANQLISQLNKSDIKYTLGDRYDTLLSGFEVVIKAKDFTKLDSLLGGKSTLIVGDTYNKCETQVVTNEVDVYETGIFDSSSSEYQGDGVVVAVLDTGLDYTHTAFSVDNFHTTNEELTLAKVSEKISGTTAAKFSGNLTGNDVYVSKKVPFAYDYADKDPDVFPINSEHGTHVAGIIAGNDDTITGVAPNAQLAIMKVFSDKTDGARTSWIIAGLEDCVKIGVDVINMSLGTSCGFTREVDKENINVIYDSIKEAGISLITAASNDYNATFGSEKNGSNGLTSNPDSGTVGAPSTYGAALSVASVDGVKTPYLMYGDDIIYFTEASNSASKRKDFVDDILKTLGDGSTSHEFEYVTIPGVGRSSDYMESNEFYKGKIVLVKRGTTTFEDKVRVALNEKGASGIIIYNNVSGTISMSVGKDIGAVCSISQDEGEKLAAAQTGKLLISKSQTAGPFMSDFSSWGPTSDLKIKPEITAHGGEILSSVPGQDYDRLSGTSMASPNQAGATALIRQYVKYSGTFGDLSTSDETTAKKVTALVNQLMMSTADIVYNKNGLPYAVRKQGAGLVNITKAYTSASYITTFEKDGTPMDKSKLELGDDKGKTGVYEMTFDITNVSNASVSYEIGSVVMTEGVSTTYTGHGDTTVTQDGRLLDASTDIKAVSGGLRNGDTVTISAGGTATVTVVITLSDADKQYMDASFAHGMYVEGFITLKATSGTTVDMNVPMLAFYGDWTEAPIFDEEYYDTNADEINAGLDPEDKLMADAYATRVTGGLFTDYIATLGTYYFIQDPASTQIAADKSKIAISNHEDGEASSVTQIRSVSAGLLRNCKTVYITVVEDATGNIVFDREVSNKQKSYSYGGSTIYGSEIEVEFAALEHQLNNNTRYTVTLTAYIDFDGEQKNVRNTFTFPLFIDYEAPIVTDVAYRTEYDKTTKKTQLFADLSVYDNHYAMGIQVGQVYRTEDSYFAFRGFGKYVTPVYSSFNSTSTVTVELTDYIKQIKEQSSGFKYDRDGNLVLDKDGNLTLEENNNSFVAIVYDYAMNTAMYEIRLPDELISAMFNTEEIRLSPNETLDVTSPENGILSVYPVNTWLQILDYSSDNPEVADVINQTILAKQSGYANLKVEGKDAKGKTVSASVTVHVLAEGEEGYVAGYSLPEINKFTLTGHTTNKAFYSISSSDRDIGTTDGDYNFAGDYNLSMYPSESITLKYELDSYFADRTAVTYSVGNEKVATVDEKGTVVAQAEGSTIVFLTVTFDGKPTTNSARVSISVKDPFVTNSIYLNAYRGLGGEVIIPDDRGVTTISAFAFSNYDYVAKDTAAGDVIDDEDPYFIKQWYLGEDTITRIVIPEGVEEIQQYAFAKLTALKEVVLPSTLKRIGVGAFAECAKLESVVGLEYVKFINNDAFKGCNLSDVNLSGVVAIGDNAFANCKIINLVLPASAQSLGIGAFRENEWLTSVEFRASQMKIGSYAFADCGRLISVNINAAVISSHAFENCEALRRVTIGRDVSVIGEYAFAGAGVSTFSLDPANSNFELKLNGTMLFTKNSGELILVAPAYSALTVRLDKLGVTEIADGAYAGNLNIQTVYGEGITKIGAYAFAGCENLRQTYFDSLVEIDEYAFYNTNLQETPDLSQVKYIGDSAFAFTSIKKVTVADDAVIGTYAFAYNTQLVEVTVGKRVNVGEGAFYAPINYVATYENNVGNYTIEEFRPYFDRYYTAFTYTPVGGESKNYYRYNFESMANSVLEKVTIGEGTVLGEGAFSDSIKLTSLTLGDGVVIGEGAFFNCFSLTDVDLSKVKVIGASAFSGTQTVNFEKAEDGINYTIAYEYSYASGEEEIMGLSVFSSTPRLTSVNLSSVTELGESAFAAADMLEQITLCETLTEIPDYAFAYTAIKNLTLPVNVKVIGAYAFAGTLLENTLDLSDVSVIGTLAFGETNLTAVILNAEGSIIGDGAFAYNYNLDTVENLDKATEIGASAFVRSSLVNVVLTNAEYIGSFAFAYSNVTQVTLGSALKVLGDNPFVGCEISTFGKLQNKEFGGNAIGIELVENYDVSATVKVIDGVLYQVVPNGLELVSYPAAKQDKNYEVVEGTVRVSSEAFAYSPVKNVTLPKSLKTLGDKAFYGCENLATVVFKGYEAPLLEESYDQAYAQDEYNIPFLNGISKFYMWNPDSTNFYYGATFVDYLGSSNGNVVMVKPVNGTGYDTFVFAQYFGATVQGGAAPTKETDAVIEMIAQLKDAIQVTLDDEAAIVAARNAYDKLIPEQQVLVYNYERLTAAEGTLNFLKPGEEKPDDDTNDGNELTFMQKNFYIGYIIAGVAVLALVAYVLIDKFVLKGKKKAEGEEAVDLPDESGKGDGE